MIHFWNTLNIQITGDTAVTLGKFDGLHRGHQKLLDDIKSHQLSKLTYQAAILVYLIRELLL